MTDKDKWERELNEKAEVAKQLPEIGKALEALVRSIFEMTEGQPGLRGIVIDEIVGAFRQARSDARHGKPLRIAESITALGEGMAKSVRRARHPEPPKKLIPLRKDTAVRARRDFKFSDAGQPNVMECKIAEGAIVLLPRAIADAAQAAGAAEILPPPAGKRLRFVGTFAFEGPDGSRRAYNRAVEAIVPNEIAQAAIADGAAVELDYLLEEELRRYRGAPLPAFPSDSRLSLSTGRPSRGAVDLGEFNAAHDADTSPPPEKRSKANSAAAAGAP